jgi:hypothetical protein
VAEPTQKAPEIDEVIKEVLGINRIESIRSNKCVFGDPPHDASKFRNDISQKEYRISGLCQECQDSVFGKD